MKRNGLTITALAVATTLTLPLAPDAAAQSSVGASIDPADAAASDAAVGSSTSGISAEVNAVINELIAPIEGPITDVLAANSTAHAGTQAQSQSWQFQSGLVAMPTWSIGAEAGQFAGKTWFYHEGGTYVVDKKEASNLPLTGDANAELPIITFAVINGLAVPANKAQELAAAYQLEINAPGAKPALPNFEPGAKAGEINGVTWYYHQDGFHLVNAPELATQPLPATGTLSIYEFSVQTGLRLPENLVQRSLSVSTTTETTQTTQTTTGTLPNWGIGIPAGILGGQEWFYTIDKRYLVNNPQLVNETVNESRIVTVPGQADSWMEITTFARQIGHAIPGNLRGDLGLEGQAAPQTQVTNNGQLNRDAAFAAGIVLPAILLIGGTYWYLNQDGRTYIADQGRTSGEPTQAEREASANMLSSHRAEAAAQIEASNQANAKAEAKIEAASAGETRGMGAETGSNEFGKGLLTLVIASILGAAVFAFGRRQLV